MDFRLFIPVRDKMATWKFPEAIGISGITKQMDAQCIYSKKSHPDYMIDRRI